MTRRVRLNIYQLRSRTTGILHKLYLYTAVLRPRARYIHYLCCCVYVIYIFFFLLYAASRKLAANLYCANRFRYTYVIIYIFFLRSLFIIYNTLVYNIVISYYYIRKKNVCLRSAWIRRPE